MCVTIGICEVWCAVRHAEIGDKVPLYFIEHEDFYDRLASITINSITTTRTMSCGLVFCRATLQLIIDLNLRPDIIQVNDWQTAPVPAYLKT
jgi:starch synthase